MIEEVFYTPQEIQKLLKKGNVRTIYRYIYKGALKATKIQNKFYIREKDLREFLKLNEPTEEAEPEEVPEASEEAQTEE